MATTDTAASPRGLSRIQREHQVISRSLQKLLLPGPDIDLIGVGDGRRTEVEAFIADKFHTCHNARIDSFLPALLSMRCGQRHTAALGINPARLGPLFLEQYLDHPVEQAVASVVRAPVSRESIVEIGNLVSTLSGATALLYLMLVATIHRSGYHWVMFTATPEVRRSIEKLGFRIASVCEADPSRLANPDQWGSYYAVSPQVMVGYIGDSYQTCLDNRLLETVLQLQATTVEQLSRDLSQL